LRFHQMAADPAQAAHTFSGATPSINEMIRYLRDAGLRARVVNSSAQKVVATPLPAVALMDGGSCVLLAKATAERVLIVDPTTQQPRILPMADFTADWTGQLILATKRANLSDLGRRFDIGWFLSAIHKYRRILVEVLAASLFLQIFALISPLFFQVVIDKVLVHRGLSTLDIIVAGLITIACFEATLGFLRTYTFAHTTNRIDVELGARLFRHLLALPLPYFQARRVGDSVARVRELENIRNFLTSSALTLVIDLVFTSVFLGVMAIYSLQLTGIVLASLPLYAGLSLAVNPAVPPSAGSKVPPQRREPGLPGRSGRRCRNVEVDGGGTADAAALGGAARRLC
jgi:subfamily B ATP-binding cassette protein HlyB/CyaB